MTLLEFIDRNSEGLALIFIFLIVVLLVAFTGGSR